MRGSRELGIRIAMAMVLASSMGLTPESALAQSYPGMVLEQAGIRFLTPSGFDLSVTRVPSDDGGFDVVLLEPRDGVVSGHLNSAFLSISIYASERMPDEVLAQTVARLSSTFARSGPIEVSDETQQTDAGPREWIRLDFRLDDVALIGRLKGFRDGGRTVVIYVQGRPEELEELARVFTAIVDSVAAAETAEP